MEYFEKQPCSSLAGIRSSRRSIDHILIVILPLAIGQHQPALP